LSVFKTSLSDNAVLRIPPDTSKLRYNSEEIFLY